MIMVGYEVTVPAGESITEAVRKIPDDGKQAVVRLMPGVYREKVEILRSHTEICGDGMDQTAIVWSDAATEILEDGKKRGTFRTATFRTDADYITLQGITIRNESGPREDVGQCIALYADGDYFVCRECKLVSYQDTLFTAPLPPKEIIKDGFIGPKQYAPRKPQRHIYQRTVIYGDIDFIFGGAAAWFEECDIIAVDGRSRKDKPYIAFCTAASTPEGQKYGYVFHRCRFLGEGVPEHSVYLGRPWRSFAKTVFIECSFGNHICPDAFQDWEKPDFHEHGMYAVYPSPSFSGEMKYARVLTPDEANLMTEQSLMSSL